jgi:hypothetical protein
LGKPGGICLARHACAFTSRQESGLMACFGDYVIDVIAEN